VKTRKNGENDVENDPKLQGRVPDESCKRSKKSEINKRSIVDISNFLCYLSSVGTVDSHCFIEYGYNAHDIRSWIIS